MADNLSPDRYRAEIASLNEEIKALTERLSSAAEPAAADKYDPFGNPTDYKGFSGDYSVINPKIEQPGYKLPLHPGLTERRNLQRFYSIGGCCVLLRFLLATGLSWLLSFLVFLLLRLKTPELTSAAARIFMQGTSISAAINTIVFLLANIVSARLGLRRAKIKTAVLLRTHDFSFSDGVQYSLIGAFIWYVCTYAVQGLEWVCGQIGFTVMERSAHVDMSEPKILSILVMYSCIIAPITEELFFRGMLLRVLGKADQRFAVYSTALLFGFAHGNIPQFILGFIMGLFLAHITLKHGSVIPAAGVHIFVNTLSLASELFREELPGLRYAAEMVLVVMAALGLLLLLIFRISDKIPLATPEQNKRGLATASGSLMYSAAVTVLFFMLALRLLNANFYF